METRRIFLTVTLHCTTVDPSTTIPAECDVEDTVQVAFPAMDAKNVVFPKLIEGATERVLTRHQNAVGDFLSKKTEQERARKERAQYDLWQSRSAETSEPAQSEQV